jgi:hypothetical protein
MRSNTNCWSIYPSAGPAAAAAVAGAKAQIAPPFFPNFPIIRSHHPFHPPGQQDRDFTWPFPIVGCTLAHIFSSKVLGIG